MGRYQKYPYTEWIDGQWHELDPQTWNTTVVKLRATLHQWARANGYVLRTVANEDTLSVRFFHGNV